MAAAMDPVYPNLPTRLEVNNLVRQLKVMEQNQKTLAHYLLIIGASTRSWNLSDIDTLRCIAGIEAPPINPDHDTEDRIGLEEQDERSVQ